MDIWTFEKFVHYEIPHQLTAKQRDTRMGLSLSHLERNHEEEHDFLTHILIGDEIWCHPFEPESKLQIKLWKHATSAPPKKSKAHTIFLGRSWCPSFWLQRPTACRFPRTGNHHLRQAIKSKRSGIVSNGVILLHDNACPHKANAVKTTLQQFYR